MREIKKKVTRFFKTRTNKQYSKVWLSRWQVFVMVWISIYCSVDIYFNHSTNTNNIIALLITSVVATMIPYFAKSYFETKEEKKMEMFSEMGEVEE